MAIVSVEEAERLRVDGTPFKVTMQSSSSGYTTRLSILRYGSPILQGHDGGEPEDNSFGRDWSWVSGAIEQAYQLGLRDGKAGKK